MAELERLQEKYHLLQAEFRELAEERTAIAKALEYEEKMKRAARAENMQFRNLLNELYPAIAGLVISAEKKGNVERWNNYCKKIIQVLS